MYISDCGLPPHAVKALKRKHIETVEEFMDLCPSNYFTPVQPSSIDQGFLPMQTAISGKAGSYKRFDAFVGMNVTCKDGTRVFLKWFNQPYIGSQISVFQDRNVIVQGRLSYDPVYGYSISNPDFIDFEEVTGDIIPKRRKIPGISNTVATDMWSKCRIYVQEALELPVLQYAGLSSKQEMYRSLHFPADRIKLDKALQERRLRDMLFFAVSMKQTHPVQGKGFVFTKDDLAQQYIDTLEYPLTSKNEKGDGQKEAIETIRNRTQSGTRLYMLLQGDVGCGKTTVAFYSALLAVSNGYQAVIMAPTTVLAEQHYLKLKAWQESNTPELRIAYLSGELTAKQKKELTSQIAAGKINIIIGTHSVISESVKYHNLGLAIVDEEHKFGVLQREAIKAKADDGIHIINMSATPLPRSLAEVVYGDNCVVASIKVMPGNRIPVKTAVTDNAQKIYAFLLSQLQAGHQAYIVCPRVETDEKTEKESVTEALKRYEAALKGTGYSIATLHGKMKKTEMADAIDRFKKNEVQVLLSTTVVEVGVDVPNATLIIIEDADMFGLASLHQLRGRVGRGQYESFCILASKDVNCERLQTLYRTKDGFVIAEKDSEFRGSGNLLGVNQTGSDKYIDMVRQYPEEYQKANEIANWMIQHGYTAITKEREQDNIQ